MQTLSVQQSDENGLSFELIVDGAPLRTLVDGASGGIPYWIVDDDLPYFPPSCNSAGRGREERIVCVCACGEYGCGHTRCRITKEEEAVLFSDFTTDAEAPDRVKQFRFRVENYDSVVASIVAATNAKKNEDA